MIKTATIALCSALACIAQASSHNADQALAWAAANLWQQQHADGSWRSGHYAMLRSGQALTPFVLHALLAVPEDVYQRPHDRVDRALAFIRKSTNRVGAIGVADADLLEYPNYSTAHAIKCLLTAGDASDRPLVRRMASYLVAAQYHESNGFPPAHPAHGGWGFAPPARAGVAGHMDLAHTRYVLEAITLADAQLDDLSIEATVLQRAEHFLRLVQKHPSETRPHPVPTNWLHAEDAWHVGAEAAFDGGFYFSPVVLAANKAGFAEDPPHWRSYATATCDGLLALRATGARDDDPRIIDALRWLARHRDLDLPGGIPQEQPVAWAESIRFYHYAVRARVQRHWQPAEGADVPLRRLIAARQQSDGSFINLRGHLMKEDDPLVCTALAVLALAETE